MTKKDAFYFSHDSNARHDPKISEMLAEYGMQGYGIYWCVIEMLREQKGYKLELKRLNAIAMQTHTNKNEIEMFIKDGIDEFNLFRSDGEYFWSESLLKRMQVRDDKSKKARQSAMARWSKTKPNRKMRPHSDRNAKNKRKVKVKKQAKKKTTKPKRKKYGEYKHVLLTPSQYDNLLQKWGQRKLDHMIQKLDEGIEMKGYKYKNHNLAIQNWEKRDKSEIPSEPTQYEVEDE